MTLQHISLIIADRPYRISVGSEQEEKQCRIATDLISKKMKEYAENFAYRDKQDLLAMAALQFAVDVLKSRESSEMAGEITEKVNKLDELLDDYLNKK